MRNEIRTGLDRVRPTELVRADPTRPTFTVHAASTLTTHEAD